MKSANKIEYITGTGQRMWNIHDSAKCVGRLCVIHNPTTEGPECDWPTHWREDRSLMERVCPCGIGHPASEHLAYLEEIDPERAKWEGIHGCGPYCHSGMCGWINTDAPSNGIGPICKQCHNLIDNHPSDHAIDCQWQ